MISLLAFHVRSAFSRYELYISGLLRSVSAVTFLSICISLIPEFFFVRLDDVCHTNPFPIVIS